MAGGGAKAGGLGGGYLTAEGAAALDRDLMVEHRYGLEQLMELAGLSVAVAVAREYPASERPRVLVVCGPGNNGGDGLVAARHLALFGYRPSVLYPRRPERAPFPALLHQCRSFGVSVLETPPDPSEHDLLVDALFGFGFRPPVREELRPALELLVGSELPVCCVDVPSGWDVDGGPPGEGPRVRPALLVSLSAPKPCARPDTLDALGTVHYLGGRFLPPAVLLDYGLSGLPPYPHQDPVLRLSGPDASERRGSR